MLCVATEAELWVWSCSTVCDSYVCMWLCLSWQCDVVGTACMLVTEHVTVDEIGCSMQPG